MFLAEYIGIRTRNFCVPYTHDVEKLEHKHAFGTYERTPTFRSEIETKGTECYDRGYKKKAKKSS